MAFVMFSTALELLSARTNPLESFPTELSDFLFPADKTET
jgi:hypothetical protein